jgi:hypothetical protein
MIDDMQSRVLGYVRIIDVDSQEVLVDTTNAVNFESMSYAMALALSDRPNGTIMSMCFGNGASSVSAVGGVTYLPANVHGIDASLYNQTYAKFVDDNNPLDTDPVNNFIRVNHIAGSTYSDLVVTCLLDYGEPAGQDSEDNSTNNNATYTFDEMGLKTWNPATSTGMLLTHVIFHPVQKALNRKIEVIYTVRIILS